MLQQCFLLITDILEQSLVDQVLIPIHPMQSLIPGLYLSLYKYLILCLQSLSLVMFLLFLLLLILITLQDLVDEVVILLHLKVILLVSLLHLLSQELSVLVLLVLCLYFQMLILKILSLLSCFHCSEMASLLLKHLLSLILEHRLLHQLHSCLYSILPLCHFYLTLFLLHLKHLRISLQCESVFFLCLLLLFLCLHLLLLVLFNNSLEIPSLIHFLFDGLLLLLLDLLL